MSIIFILIFLLYSFVLLGIVVKRLDLLFGRISKLENDLDALRNGINDGIDEFNELKTFVGLK